MCFLLIIAVSHFGRVDNTSHTDPPRPTVYPSHSSNLKTAGRIIQLDFFFKVTNIFKKMFSGSVTTRQEITVQETGNFITENRLEALPTCFPQSEE